MTARLSAVLLLLLGAWLMPVDAQQDSLDYSSGDNVLTFTLFGEWYVDEESGVSREHYRYVFVQGEPNPFAPAERSAILMDVVNINQNSFYDFADDADDLPDYLRTIFNDNPIWEQYEDYKLGDNRAITVITRGAAQTILFQLNEAWIVAATVFTGENEDFDADVESLRNILLSVELDLDAEASRYRPYTLAPIDLSQTFTSDDDAFQVDYPASWKLVESDVLTDTIRPFSYLGNFSQDGENVEMVAQVFNPANEAADFPGRLSSIDGYLRVARNDPGAQTYSLDGDILVIVPVDGDIVAVQAMDEQWVAYVLVDGNVPDAENIAVNVLQTISIVEVEAVVSMLMTGLSYPLPQGYDVLIQQFNNEEGDETILVSTITGTELIVQAGTPEMLRARNTDQPILFRFIDAATEELSVLSLGGDVIGTRVVDGNVVLVVTEFVGDESTDAVEQVVRQILTDIAPSGEGN
jgi:hypothetical protein